MARGGARTGSGRPKGTPNARTVEVLAKALATDKTPVEYMLDVLRDETADPKDRQWAAEKAAPFCHPRPAPAPRTVEIDLPDVSTHEGITEALTRIAQAAASGEIAPSEAHSFVSIINAQQENVTITEILERLKQLEARQPDKHRR